jgi:hypothetical protein
MHEVLIYPQVYQVGDCADLTDDNGDLVIPKPIDISWDDSKDMQLTCTLWPSVDRDIDPLAITEDGGCTFQPGTL